MDAINLTIHTTRDKSSQVLGFAEVWTAKEGV